jgi:hypothetical protein
MIPLSFYTNADNEINFGVHETAHSKIHQSSNSHAGKALVAG